MWNGGNGNHGDILPGQNRMGSKRAQQNLLKVQQQTQQTSVQSLNNNLKKPLHRSNSWSNQMPPLIHTLDPFENRPTLNSNSGVPAPSTQFQRSFNQNSNSTSLPITQPLFTAGYNSPVAENRHINRDFISPEIQRSVVPRSMSALTRELDGAVTNSISNVNNSILLSSSLREDDNVQSSYESSSVSSKCFSLVDNRVTSLVMSPDGSYCFAGFVTGTIRLFDLTVGGIDDEDDRFGIQIGKIDSTASAGMLNVYLQIGGGVDVKNCCHLFAGARLGSTSMLVVDLVSLRDTKLKRGFFTMAGGSVQLFKKSDNRLKGFSSLSCQLITTSNTSLDSREYCTVYRLVTGKGFGSYHVWKVELTAKMTATGLQYSDVWQVIFNGKVNNGPNMTFAHLAPGIKTRDVSGDTVHFRFPADELINSTFDKEARLLRLLTAPAAASTTAVSSLDAMSPPAETVPDAHFLTASKATVLKGVLDLRYTSEDGLTLFSGMNELIIGRYHQKCSESNEEEGADSRKHTMLELKSKCVFVLSSDVVVSKSSRHLRQIEDVSCTTDGAYALISCSDNTVYLYSECDVFSRGYTASSSNSYTQEDKNCSDGFLTLLFQCRDHYKLDLSISYAIPPPQSSGESDEQLADITQHNQHTCLCADNSDGHLSAEHVLMSVSWWHDSEGGVLKTCRLKLPTASSSSSSGADVTSNQHVVPLKIAVPNVGLFSNCTSQHSSSVCLVCGDSLKHWKDAEVMKDFVDLTTVASDAAKKKPAAARNNTTTSVTVLPSDDDLSNTESDEEGDDNEDAEDTQHKKVTASKNRKSTTKRKSTSPPTTGKANSKSKTKFHSEAQRLDSSFEDFGEDSRLTAPDSDFMTTTGDYDEEEVQEVAEEVAAKKRKISSKGTGNNKEDSDILSQLKSQVLELNKQVTVLTSQNAELCNDVAFATNEMNRIMRRSDLRFDKEKECRKQWNIEKNLLNEVNATAEKDKARLLDALQESEQRMKNIAETLVALSTHILNPGNSMAVASQQLSDNNITGISLLSSPLLTGNPTSRSRVAVPAIKAFFCIACQDHTADVMLLRCGHVCLCRVHAEAMRNMKQLQTCPLCKMACDGFAPLIGVERV